MAVSGKKRIVYVTSNPFKIEENQILAEKGTLRDGTLICDLFEFEIRQVPIKEILEVDIRIMVQEEVIKAYSQLKVPCIVEHAGLIFADHKGRLYPGGLTKPMWDVLGDRFINETQSAGREAFARAVVAYCDGMSVKTFVGETAGTIANTIRGARKFYWDTVFIPQNTPAEAAGKTYAEIVEDSKLGLEFKVLKLSQSTQAMITFLEYIKGVRTPQLWR
jgi:inosine/xanthosine triphosphate pyrophosphatase family protein